MEKLKKKKYTHIVLDLESTESKIMALADKYETSNAHLVKDVYIK
jgi:hypothetical protein